ncbi:MAG: hypothetical protein IJ806_03880 [Ruminococcus sp.]|nr:hypothetical protein [Ruminococcus sp.]
MNSFDRLSKEQTDALLRAAAGKLGTDPADLEKQLKNGQLGKALSRMPENEAAMLTKALSDKNTCEKILSSPQAKALFKKLSSG